MTEALRRRRMCRNFSDRPLASGVIEQLLEGALRAPSAGNTQGRDFVLLEGPEETALYWNATTDPAWRARSSRFEGLARAPVVVLPYADPEAYAARYREPDKAGEDGREMEWPVPYWLVDTAFAIMALLLGATDLGLGAAFLGNFRGEEDLRTALGVPPQLCWLGAVLVGEPRLPDPPSSSAGRARRTLGMSVHRGGWGPETG